MNLCFLSCSGSVRMWCCCLLYAFPVPFSGPGNCPFLWFDQVAPQLRGPQWFSYQIQLTFVQQMVQYSLCLSWVKANCSSPVISQLGHLVPSCPLFLSNLTPRKKILNSAWSKSIILFKVLCFLDTSTFTSSRKF